MASQSQDPRDRRNQDSPYVPLLIRSLNAHRTVRREFWTNAFWTSADLENKLLEFRDYYKGFRTIPHCAAERPDQDTGQQGARRPPRLPMAIPLRGLYQTPKAA